MWPDPWPCRLATRLRSSSEDISLLISSQLLSYRGESTCSACLLANDQLFRHIPTLLVFFVSKENMLVGDL